MIRYLLGVGRSVVGFGDSSLRLCYGFVTCCYICLGRFIFLCFSLCFCKKGFW